MNKRNLDSFTGVLIVNNSIEHPATLLDEKIRHITKIGNDVKTEHKFVSGTTNVVVTYNNKVHVLCEPGRITCSCPLDDSIPPAFE